MTDEILAWIIAFYAKGKNDAKTEIETALLNVDTYFDSRIEKGVLHILKVESATVENGIFNITTEEE